VGAGEVTQAAQLRDLRRARRLALHKRRIKADDSLCYRCFRRLEYLYPFQFPGYWFPYEGESEGAATDVVICADCLRDVCELLTRWVLNRPRARRTA
jgi:hypothetical protein